MSSLADLLSRIISIGWPGLLLLFALQETGIPIPVVGIGLFLYAGYRLSLGFYGDASHIAAASIAGSLLGSSAMYWLARRGASPFLRKYVARFHINPETVNRLEEGFRRWGVGAIFIGRLTPGLIAATSFGAGLLRFSYPLFTFCVVVEATIWSALFLGLGVSWGINGRLAARFLGPFSYLAWLVPIAVIIIAMVVIRSRGWKPRWAR